MRSISVAILFVGSSIAAQGQVHVVDQAGGPGAEFTSIADAQAVAQPGDVVLVRGGDYGLIHDPRAHVVGEFGQVVRIGGTLQDVDRPAGRPCLVQGLEFQPFGTSVRLVRADGPVWFERCEFQAIKPDDFVAGFRATECAAVALSQCRGFPQPFSDEALEVVDSRVHVHASELHGDLDFFEGGPSVSVRARGDSFLEFFGTLVTGDDGTEGTPSSCNGGDGSDAVHVRDTSRLVTLGSTLEPGEGGAPFGGCTPGADGDAIVLDPGASALSLPGIARTLTITSPVREGEFLQVLIGGKPGDIVWLRYAEAPGPGIGFTALDGEFLLGSSSLALVATIPPSGQLDRTILAPDLSEGWESTVFWCQAVLRDVDTHRFVVSSPSALVLIDESL